MPGGQMLYGGIYRGEDYNPAPSEGTETPAIPKKAHPLSNHRSKKKTN